MSPGQIVGGGRGVEHVDNQAAAGAVILLQPLEKGEQDYYY